MLYNLAIHLFSLAIALASLFNKKACALRNGRRNIVQHIEQTMATLHKQYPNANTTWVHCASLGEFEQGRPIIERLKQQTPNEIIVVTFFSPSGYEIRKNYTHASAVFYLPPDTSRAAKRTVTAIKPTRAIFVKYEYWHNMLKQLQLNGSKIYLVSAYFQPNMAFFKSWGGFFRNMLRRFTWLYVQNAESQELLQSLNLTNVTVAGDTRFDRVADLVNAAPQVPIVEAFAKESDVMVCGSTWPADEELLAELVNNNQQTKFIIAPHQINASNIAHFIELCPNRKVARYTETSLQAAAQADLLIIDCIGILSGVYRYGRIAYIGGGFGAGIHNILEAATWGLPVIFGPKYQRFAEAVELIETGAAISISNKAELNEAFISITNNNEALSTKAADYVASRCGATQLIINDITA